MYSLIHGLLNILSILFCYYIISQVCPYKDLGSAKAKIEIIKILKEQFNFSLNQTKEYVDSCIGKFNILPKAITRTEIDEIAKKLKPYGIIIP